MSNACRLFPWRDEQKISAEKLWQSLEAGEDEKSQLKAMLELCASFIFQLVRGDMFVSGLMHFLAILGIDEDTNRLKQANDYSYLLTGVVYCTRMFAIETILPSGEREEQDEKDDNRFLMEREKYLADGSYSPMSKMISLLAYSKNLALNHGNAGSITWNRASTVMELRGRPIAMLKLKKMISDVITEAETLLWSKLMWTGRDDRFEMSLEDMEDDVTWTKRGVSFVSNSHNNLQDGHQWMLKKSKSSEAGRRLRVNGIWQARSVRRYLREVNKFREVLLFCVHLTGGQPARGTEITSVRFRNGFLQDRNIFVMHGHMVTITRYHKSQSQYDTPKVILRFLPWRVGQLLAVYLSYVQPFQELLTVQTDGSAGWSDYLWANKQGPWETDHLTKVIARETQKHLGSRLTTQDYRHGAIAIGRKFVGQDFARGYNEEIGEVEEAEVDEDDPLELSAGRGSGVGSRRYGVSTDIVKHLSSRSIDTFRSLSEKWHQFLGLSSYGGKGQKREVGTIESNDEKQHYDRRGRGGASGRRMMGNNIIWDLSTARAAAQYMGEHPETAQQGGHEEDGWLQTATPVQRHRKSETNWTTPVVLQHWSPNDTGVMSSPLDSRQCSRQLSHQFSLDVGLVIAETSNNATLQGMMMTPQSQRSPLARRKVDGSLLYQLPSSQTVGEEDVIKAMQKVLAASEVSFKSEEQKQAMEAIVSCDQSTPLVIILPTGGGKSLLFMVPACLSNPGVTIVVVPFRALINNLVETAKRAGIDSIEWRPSESNPATLVFVSADFVSNGNFQSYSTLLRSKGILRRVFVDECHLTFTASDWRAKLAHVRAVRGFGCPTVLLTATLPCLLEFELEEAMSAQMARYIRAVTTRVKTRYIVETCSRGKLEETVIALYKRMISHLGRQKGVVYSRSRDQCEDLAEELGCAYYHAGAVDNEERLAGWLEKGGLIVATSALGTGVDFPGIVFVLHVNLPYSMIDFAQESGRAGRGGEDIDSVIIIEEGSAERMSRRMRGTDEFKMMEFVTTRGCRRAVMSTYLDGKVIECREDGMARCDRCGEGLTALERSYKKAARDRQVVEEKLDEIADGCVSCWLKLDGDCSHEDWMHASKTCKEREKWGLGEEECDKLRQMIQYEASSHSCHKCSISQKLCATGRDEKARCRWANVVIPILLDFTKGGVDVSIIRRIGFEGETDDMQGYTRWLGLRHRRRVWGELMSNSMAVLVEVILMKHDMATNKVNNERQEDVWTSSADGFGQKQYRINGNIDSSGIQNKHGHRRDGHSEDDLQEVGELETIDAQEREEGVDRQQRMESMIQSTIQSTIQARREANEEVKLSRFMERLWEWRNVCLICKARYGVEACKEKWSKTDEREADRHRHTDCPRADDLTRELVDRGLDQAGAMRPGKYAGCSRCWLLLGLCRRFKERDKECRIGRRRFDLDSNGWCGWIGLAKSAAMALLYVEPQEVREWVTQDKMFREQCKERGEGRAEEDGGVRALEGFFGRQVRWGRTDSNMICELIWIWG